MRLWAVGFLLSAALGVVVGLGDDNHLLSLAQAALGVVIALLILTLLKEFRNHHHDH